MSGQIEVKWNTKNLEIKTKSVEEQLRPLVLQVTTLINGDNVKRKRGKSKNAAALISAVEQATRAFIEKGEQIAKENPEVEKNMMALIQEIRTSGTSMSSNSRNFTADPCSSEKRKEMVNSARQLLSAVTRLLILADMIDINLLLISINLVKNDLESLKKDPKRNLESLQKNTDRLLGQAAIRQREIQDPENRDDLSSSRAQLKKFSPLLLSATKAYVNHPSTPSKSNQDFIIKQMCQAVDTISHVTQGKPVNRNVGGKPPGNLAVDLKKLDELLQVEPLNYNKVRSKAMLESQLNNITSGALLFTNSSGVRDERKDKIVAGCDAVKAALQDLLTAYMNNSDKKEKTEELENATKNMNDQTRDLTRQMRKAVADNISDFFVAPTFPLEALVTAARAGDIKRVEELSKQFEAHADKLVEVALLSCQLSNNEDGVKMVQYAAMQIKTHAPAVTNAAKILAAYPGSKTAQDNMETFEASWRNLVNTLTEAVDDIVVIDDILSAFENGILDDINTALAAVQDGNVELLVTMAETITERSARIKEITEAEMFNYEPCTYTKRVLQAIKILNDTVMPKFEQNVKMIIQKLSSQPPLPVDDNEFIDSSRLMYDAIREVRRAVLMNRTDDELDPEEVELETSVAFDTSTLTIQKDVSGITVARQAMYKLPEQEKQKILKEVEGFQNEKLTFDKEVAKWDDVGNDIVVIAKHMCMIMMQMTDFVGQKGPLKSTTDVINAAKKISEAGVKLDKLTKQIADQCPESSTKDDLLAYLERVALYSHQINIISRVKADVQNTNEELIVAGVESATSLVQNAKNLMNAVVLTVKASYVASTKYSRQATISDPIVIWKMKIPEKKPLVISDKKHVNAVVRKASQKRPQNPILVLSEFHNVGDAV